MGSLTFIIVALRWSENSSPRSLASAICSARKVRSARRLMKLASITSPASSTTLGLSTATAPSAPWNSIRATPASSSATVVATSLWRKSPPLMLATCEGSSGDQSPIE